ncbi:MAG: DNA mismatch repair endonuclease MutL [Lachnospiraceae bacterium]|nr:DNA mismatch repair endonuclease MutL [Lachnospiraceae bacterium]MDY4836938.1 DNA mismatch repair endonuclease MutL [Lachnospiraceae bacterium]
MKNINILDSNTIDKIAAGEVVERPSAVVKELVENSIDANADAVTIEIKDGGISFIRITDNGEGIDRSQVKKAFMRHATSKIKSVEDLISVTSLGFRGEALSSISAVSKVEFLTKTKTDFIGTRYVVEGGRECVFEDAGIPDGTTIIVRDLFFNVPARKKFLKSPSSEGNNITELIEHMILSHPNISLKYIYNGNVKLQSSGKNDIKSCIYNVYGRDIANGLIEVKSIRDDISIHGFIGKPELARATRNFEIYFVNNRFIKSTLIDRALEEAYKDYLMLHKYPTVFLYFEIPSHLIDVNVHPTKREIRFFEGEALKCYIVDVIKNALINKELIKEIVEEHHEKPSVKESEINKEPFETINHIIESSYNNYYSSEIEKEDESTDINDKNEQLTLFDDKFISEESIKKHRIIGQLFNTYWLIEFENKLFIVDQHAAHEKVNYERLIKKLRNNENCSQNIYPPIVVSLSNAEAQYVTKYNENFLNVGFTIEHFGGLDYTISTVPMELLSQNPADYFHEMLDELIEGKNSKETETVNLKIATMACKASVKGNMNLSVFEADKLISELLTLENPYNCPHGRPTIISFSKYEIEKMFKRIVN